MLELAAGRVERAQQILGVQHADDVFGIVAPDRQPRIGRADDLADQLLGRQIGVERQHLGAMDHDVGDFEIPQIEQAAEHVAIGARDAALLMQKIDRAFQLLVAGQDRALLAGVDAEELQKSANEPIDGDEQRSEDRDEERQVRATMSDSRSG